MAPLLNLNIFLSYAWANREIADTIDDDFKTIGIEFKRDVRDSPYRTSIKEFMRQVGKSDFVLMIISDEYLRSESCMYEVNELLNTDDFEKRILPIVIDNAIKIFKATDRTEYYTYWQKKKNEADKNKIEIPNQDTINYAIKCQRILDNLPEFFQKITDLNVSTFGKLKERNYSDLLNIINSHDKRPNQEIGHNEEIGDSGKQELKLKGLPAQPKALLKLYQESIKKVPILKYSWVFITTICILSLSAYFKLKNSDVFVYATGVLVISFLGFVFSFLLKTRDAIIKISLYLLVYSIIVTMGTAVLGFASFILQGKPEFYKRWFPDQTIGRLDTPIQHQTTGDLDISNSLETTAVIDTSIPPNLPRARLPIPGNVQSASSGLKGFDINYVLSADQALSFKNAGYDFCIRYVPRTATHSQGNLTTAEAQDILNAGLALMVVQHCSLAGWTSKAALGTAMGTYASKYSSLVIGLPKGMNIWCDLEGIASGTAPADIIAYCQAWYNAVEEYGYVPGLYLGYDAGLDRDQIGLLTFRHFWRAYNGPQIGTPGFQLTQGLQKTLNGITFTPNVTQNDNSGNGVLWVKQ